MFSWIFFSHTSKHFLYSSDLILLLPQYYRYICMYTYIFMFCYFHSICLFDLFPYQLRWELKRNQKNKENLRKLYENVVFQCIWDKFKLWNWKYKFYFLKKYIYFLSYKNIQYLHHWSNGFLRSWLNSNPFWTVFEISAYFFSKNLQRKVYGDRSLVEFGLRNDPHTKAVVNNKINLLYFFSLWFFIFLLQIFFFLWILFNNKKPSQINWFIILFFIFFLFQILRKKQ